MLMVTPALRKLAASYGVQTNYCDVDARRIDAEPEVLVTVLRTLGASIGRAEDVEEALRLKRRASCQRMLEPVTAIWDGDIAGVRMVFPAELSSKNFKATLYLEDGQERDWSPSARTLVRAHTVDGTRYLWTRLPLPSLPHGYHRLHVSMGTIEAETFILRAPTRAYRDPARGKRWGLFAPLYALHSKDSAGIGNFGDLRRLADLTLAHGGRFVATLPLLASYPDEPSPYSPASRLFWNELYVDTGRASSKTPSKLLDYPELYAAKRHMMRDVATGRESDVAAFQTRFPLALDYARFRAAAESYGTNWTRWPDKLRDGLIEEDEPDVAADAVHYHLNSQMLAEEQIAKIAAGNAELYFDLPLGVHRFGYDTWREQTLFAHDVDVGAPPDAAFPVGQNWSFPAVLPEKSRRQNHRHLRLVYRHAMRHADLLRIDHVMGLHRQFWIPRGASVADGVYVRYPADELYATLNIESHRARCELVGENLGLVPKVVTESLARHGFRGIYVAQLTPDAPIPKGVVASLNTHDTELFATTGNDLENAVRKLMKSEAELVSVTLEDLWHETKRQNVPGTTDEHPNWRRPLRYALEDIEAKVSAKLAAIGRIRP
ncbi:MAG: 4-alpha-glucanotransferase [Acidobacteria bacterium]|nr:MAG: 4-alpha-glucanotransferase [Acidobacteriota bacterium]